MSEQKVKEILKQANRKLASRFDGTSICNLRITSLGNSIASGYSMTRTTKPLLLRNDSIKSILKESKIHLARYHFARSQNNNDEHIYEWLINNISESDIYKMNRHDYGNNFSSMPTYGLKEDDIKEYYPMDIRWDRGLRDLILESDEQLANVVVYNGITGSLIDAFDRKGKMSQQLMYGIKRDITSLEATLKYIQASNRKEESNTQVYICGIPNILGLNITEIINYQLRTVSKKYANTVYVEPVKSKFLYQKYDASIEVDPSIRKKIASLSFDVHYDEVEYLKLNHHIIEAITNNYFIVQSLIKMDRELLNLSKYLEFKNSNSHFGMNKKEAIEKDNVFIRQMIQNILTQTELSYIKNNNELEKLKQRGYSYFIERKPYDFHYLGSKNIQTVFKKTRENRKIR